MRARNLFRLLLPIVVLSAAHAGQSPAIAQLGPQIGERVPAFSGTDQFGRLQNLDSVAGDEGAMVVFFRSADW